jgi:CheY-like chemotaxis protein
MAAATDSTNPRILLVEDEKDLAHFVKEILSTLPAQVTVAKHGSEAIHLIESVQPFDLIVLDVVLPQISGLEVLRRLRRISTSTKVILSTGYADSIDSKDLTRLEISGLLGKPYTPAQLLATVRSVLWPEKSAS